MLSNVDIIKELGKNILIYPLKTNTIRGSSINLHASSLAWSVNSKESAVKHDSNGKYIELMPHDTTLVETEESIAVSDRITGTYHSRVVMASMGIGHIGTTLNPKWIGQSLIALHNHTDRTMRLEIGESFVTVMFEYLNTKSTYPDENGYCRTDVLTKLGIKISPNESVEMNGRHEFTKFELMREAMIATEEYKMLKARLTHRNIIGEFLPYVIIGIIFILTFTFSYTTKNDNLSKICISLCTASAVLILNKLGGWQKR